MKYQEINLLEFLKNYSGKKVIYCANPGNAGDALIAHATYKLFEKANIQFEIINSTQQVSDKIVFYSGGGNLVEGKYLDAYNFLQNNLEHNEEIVILPHTIYGFDDLLLSAKNLIILCREKVSYEYLQTLRFPSEHLFLVHDAAFNLETTELASYMKEGMGIANCFRKDSESSNLFKIPEENLDISLSWNGKLWHNAKLAEMVTYSLASYLCEFQIVKTDRLHIAILAALLGKQVLMYPNNFYKNKAVYEYSIKNCYKNVTFLNIDTEETANRLEAENNRLICEINQIKMNLAKKINHIADLEAIIKNFLTSKSCRFTKPLRLIKSFFGSN